MITTLLVELLILYVAFGMEIVKEESDYECYPEVKVESDYSVEYANVKNEEQSSSEQCDSDESHPNEKIRPLLKKEDFDSSEEYGTNSTFPVKSEDADSRPADERNLGNERYYFIRDKKCRYCKVKFRFATHYESHFKQDHFNIPPYHCPCCPFESWERRLFISHCRNKHFGRIILSRKSSPKRMIKCETCQTEHRSMKRFEIHNAVHHTSVKTFQCGSCQSKFTRFSGLVGHEMGKHGIGIHLDFQCRYCKRNFKRSDVLKQHEEACRKAFYKKNIPNPKITGAFVCNVNVCRKDFFTGRGLKMHKDVAHGKDVAAAASQSAPLRIKSRQAGTYKCKYCGEQYGSLRRYEAHGKLTHSHGTKNEKLFRCKECGRGFDLKRSLDRHLISVHGNPTIPCQHCRRLFPTWGGKNTHEKSCGKKRTGSDRSHVLK